MTREERDHLRRYVEDAGAFHDDGCPSDDTCECSWKPTLDVLNALCNREPAAPPSAWQPDPIVTAFHAGISAAIRRIRRAMADTTRLQAMPLNADECCTILANTKWEDEIPSAPPRVSARPRDEEL